MTGGFHETVEAWVAVAASIGTLASGLIANTTVRRWLARRQARAEDKPRETFRLGFQLSVVLNEMRVRLHAHRAMILRAHNGGGGISIRRPLYTSVHHQVSDDKLPQVHWQNEPVDEGYWQLLRRLVDEGRGGWIMQNVSELDKDCKIRALYESQGVNRAIVFELYSTPEEYWYVSCVLKEEDLAPSDFVIGELIRVAKSEISLILRDGKLPK